MKTIIPDFTYSPDTHSAIAEADFSALDGLYAGRRAYFGDYHAHAATGGTSDGQTTLEEWKVQMDRLGIDFVGIMDHRQVRHMYLDAFDPAYFLYGTEPALIVTDHPKAAEPHYLMIFEERDTLRDEVLAKLPKYAFTGGIEGHFAYEYYTHKEFEETVVKTVLAAGGAFVHAHPKQEMQSDDPEDYVFAEHTAIETIYAVGPRPALCDHTVANYRLWRELLNMGKRIYTTATSDCHAAPKNEGLNTVYTTERLCKHFVRQLKQGDLNAGFIGIKMCITDGGDTCIPMGGEIVYRDGLRLLVKIDDAHPLKYDPDEAYRVDVITNQGLAYTAPLTLPFSLCLPVEERKLYRVEILRERDGSPAAIGNPIWLGR